MTYSTSTYRTDINYEQTDTMPLDIQMLRKDQGGDPDAVRASEKKRFAKEVNYFSQIHPVHE